MMFNPRWPSAGPMGGDGFALPAGTWSLIRPTTFFATATLLRVQTDASRRPPRYGYRRSWGLSPVSFHRVGSPPAHKVPSPPPPPPVLHPPPPPSPHQLS